MKIKTYLLKTIPIFLAVFFLAPVLVNAASSDTGILPDSPFYFIEQIKENIDLMFTFNPEAKIQKALIYADKRLAEAEKMTQAGKVNAAKKATANYEEEINLSKKILERVKNDQKKSEISKRIEEKIVKDKEPLQSIADNSKSESNKNDSESKIIIDKKIRETAIPEPSPTKSLKPVEIKKPNETPSVIEKQGQKQKEIRPSACNYIYEEGASLYNICVQYYSDAEKLEAKNLKQEKEKLQAQKQIQEKQQEEIIEKQKEEIRKQLEEQQKNQQEIERQKQQEIEKQRAIQAEIERQKVLQEQKRIEQEKALQEAKRALEQIVNQKISVFNSQAASLGAQISSKKDEINKINSEYDKKIDQSRNRLASRSFIYGEMANLNYERNYKLNPLNQELQSLINEYNLFIGAPISIDVPQNLPTFPRLLYFYPNSSGGGDIYDSSGSTHYYVNKTSNGSYTIYNF